MLDDYMHFPDQHIVEIEPELWKSVMQATRERGEYWDDIVRHALKLYVEYHNKRKEIEGEYLKIVQ